MKPLLVGLTGSIGSGKSLVAQAFVEQGIPVIDADLIAREVVAPNSAGLKAVIEAFGNDYLLPDGTLNRSLLGELVFRSEPERKRLESILHPLIRARFFEQLAVTSQNTTPPPELVIYMVPLLFESKFSYDELDLVVVVSAPLEQCVKRVMKRDGSSEQLARQKLAAQIPNDEKVRLADLVLENTGTPLETKQKSLALLAELRKIARERRA